MKDALYNLLTRLLAGSGLTPDDLLWGVLFGALMLAIIHLLTMLVTRWGDHRATGPARGDDSLDQLRELGMLEGLLDFGQRQTLFRQQVVPTLGQRAKLYSASVKLLVAGHVERGVRG